MPSNYATRLSALETNREPVRILPGHDYSCGEYVSAYFDIPLNAWERNVAAASFPAVKKRVLERHDLLKRAVAAMDAEDWATAAALMEERWQYHLTTLFWFKDLFKATRLAEQVEDQKECKSLARHAAYNVKRGRR